MESLKLYRIESSKHSIIHIAARSYDQASEMFVTWEAANNLVADSFSVELVALDDLDEPQRQELRELLATSCEGIAHHHDEDGWSIDSAGWFSSDPAVDDGCGVMRIFEMRDLGEIEAFVLAANQDRASELFEQHLRAHGGDPDAVMYREVSLEHLDEPANDAVYAALDNDCEGLVTCDANGSWVFIVPLVAEGTAGTDSGA